MSKLFSLSYGIASLDAWRESTGSHAASFWASSRPRDISVLRAYPMADAADAKENENASIMTGKQANESEI